MKYIIIVLDIVSCRDGCNFKSNLDALAMRLCGAKQEVDLWQRKKKKKRKKSCRMKEPFKEVQPS